MTPFELLLLVLLITFIIMIFVAVEFMANEDEFCAVVKES